MKNRQTLLQVLQSLPSFSAGYSDVSKKTGIRRHKAFNFLSDSDYTKVQNAVNRTKSGDVVSVTNEFEWKTGYRSENTIVTFVIKTTKPLSQIFVD